MKKKPSAVDKVDGYALTDHVCRICLGRVLQALDGSHHRCADCGLTAAGDVTAVCVCGAKLRTNLGAGLRCQRKPDPPTVEAPAEIVVTYVGIEHRKAPAKSKLKDGGGELFDGQRCWPSYLEPK